VDPTTRVEDLRCSIMVQVSGVSAAIISVQVRAWTLNLLRELHMFLAHLEINGFA
jgi:hypothetical protein